MAMFCLNFYTHSHSFLFYFLKCKLLFSVLYQQLLVPHDYTYS